MRITILLAAATSALAIGANPASAEERSFTGPRVEVLGGYDVIDANAPAGVDDTIDGAHLRTQLGYDVALGDTWRIGAEAGIGWQLGSGNTYTVGGSRTNLKSSRDIDLSVRIGAKLSEKTFVYAKGGWANSGFRAKVTSGATVTTVKDEEDGWRAGVGVEHMLGENLYAKAEYRYTEYNRDLHRHQALVGVGYRF